MFAVVLVVLVMAVVANTGLLALERYVRNASK